MASSSAPRRGRASVAFGSEAEVLPAGSATVHTTPFPTDSQHAPASAVETASILHPRRRSATSGHRSRRTGTPARALRDEEHQRARVRRRRVSASIQRRPGRPVTLSCCRWGLGRVPGSAGPVRAPGCPVAVRPALIAVLAEPCVDGHPGGASHALGCGCCDQMVSSPLTRTLTGVRSASLGAVRAHRA